jgi:hypothetical protein
MKLKKGEKRILITVFVLFFGSGAALFAFGKWIRVTTAIGPQHSPWESTLRAYHSAFSYLGLAGLGYMIGVHVLPGLRGTRRIRTGLNTLTLMFLLGGTALGILYSGNETWTSYWAQLHTWIGFALLAGLLLHLRKRPHATHMAHRKRRS